MFKIVLEKFLSRKNKEKADQIGAKPGSKTAWMRAKNITRKDKPRCRNLNKNKKKGCQNTRKNWKKVARKHEKAA
jgi:hypothetical protein